MKLRPLHPWDVDTGRARALQEELRQARDPRPPPGFRPRTAAGADLSVVRGRDRGYAALVVVDLETGETLAEATASVYVTFPYVPGLFSFRELPPLAAAWERLEVRPDVILFDGHGYAHPRRFGLACHGGLLFNTPSVGVAKSVLVGEYEAPGESRGATAPLIHEGEGIGTVLRTRTAVRPVYVSVGHRMDLSTAVEVVLRASPRYRIPEAVRRAHRLANGARSSGRA
ncbi:MAG TPA: endonuclease V [Longimicrobiales bacterium]|jgi:deoxyribonuclease V|nr:endonuclease V [Longimicrobiales bacterium]